MKLYLRKHARIKSYKRWTDEAGLNAEIERRKNLKISKMKDDVDNIDFSKGGIQSLYSISNNDDEVTNVATNYNSKKKMKKEKNKKFSFRL